MIGRTLTHYQIEERLGRGGMGEVWLARDTRLGRTVAIKVLPVEAATDSDSVRRFMAEARAASSLNHPNIVTIHDIDHHEDTRFIVMEHIDGLPLSAIAARPMALEQFLDVAMQITSALTAAHEAGIVHRDIKPANVMVSHSGRVKVVDFGLARLMEPSTPVSQEASTKQADLPLTAPGAVVGTLGYMSPEQIQGHRIDARSDIFSLGVLFYELLSGRRAFAGTSKLSTVAAILRDSPSPIDRGLPPRLTGAIDRCLAKNPGDRYQTVAALHAELASIRAARSASRSRVPMIAAAVLVAAVLGAVAFLLWRRESRARWMRETAAPELARLIAAQDFDGAYRLAKRALEVAPEDTQLQQQWRNIAGPFDVSSDPPGAEVWMRGYRATDREWIPLGRTPLAGAPVIIAPVRLRVTHTGYVPMEVSPVAPDVRFRLHREDETPPGMVFVPGGNALFESDEANVPDFWIDRYEVTNRQYRQFMADGGYRRRELWKNPIEKDGRTLTWEEAMRELVDATGRAGPAHWQLGMYPEGAGDHPVQGVSWYEAAAYAEYAGKTLPTVFHWRVAAGEPSIFSEVVTMSNYSGKGTVAVGSLGGLGAFGTYDMAGNVGEWCINAVQNKRYTLGGSWGDPSYTFVEKDAVHPLVRRLGTGFRTIRSATPIAPALMRPVLAGVRPVIPGVDDATFAILARTFDYDPLPLNAKVDEVDESHAAWRKEKVSFDAAYGGQRVPAFVFLPKNAKPPYQAILFFPGSDAVFTRSSRTLWLQWVDFFIRSGRAVVYPIYQGTYERRVADPRGPNEQRDLRVQRVKDVRRTLDYIATRPDLDTRRVAYYGLSLGATIGPTVLSVEDRFQCAVLLAGGLGYSITLPEVQMQNHLPRVTEPLLLLGGEDDFTRPLESSQRPFFEQLGTPPEKKRHVVVKGGHLPSDFVGSVREILAWTDRWMGPVETH